MVVPTDESWFLVECEQFKVFQCIGNYLSLGQVELARSLIRIHAEQQKSSESIPNAGSLSVVQLLETVVESGPPDSWICSDSVPSTAHLFSMCVDILRENGVQPSELLMRRCEFDLMQALVFLEVGKSEILSAECAQDLRMRYARKLLTDSDASTLLLPRILISGFDSLFSVLPSAQLAASNKGEYQLSAELTDFLFRVCISARETSVGLLGLLHTVSPITSAQLTHIQAAAVAHNLAEREWPGACFHLRFLNELAPSDVLTKAPLLTDLMSLVVHVVNHPLGIEAVASLESSITRFKQDCVSTTHGCFPFVSKKRKFLFPLASLVPAEYLPAEQLKLGLYEALSSRSVGAAGESLLETVNELEDVLLSLHCGQATLPPCFADTFPAPFWDGYFDFVRMARVHAVKYPLETAVRLIRAREFSLADRLLKNFNQLKPAALLLCWDDFGVDVESRSRLLADVWRSYLKAVEEAPAGTVSCPDELENAVWTIVHRFYAAVLAAQYYRNGQPAGSGWVPMTGEAESVIDIMRQLPNHSLLFVLRAVLPCLAADAVVPQLTGLPPASFDNSSLEAGYDLDVAKSYFVLRSVLLTITQGGAGREGLGEVDNLCGSIQRGEIKLALLSKLLTLCLSTSALQRKPGGRFIVELPVLFGLVCLVCLHAASLGPAATQLRTDSQKLLVKLLLRLKESLVLDETFKVTACQSVADWARLVGADPELAARCDRLFPGTDGEFPAVKFSAKERGTFVAPPRTNMALAADKFVPRLCGETDFVLTALALNDYGLAEALASFLSIQVPEDVRSAISGAEQFKRARTEAGEGKTDLHGIGGAILIDLAICANATSEASLVMLRRSHEQLGDSALSAWASKLAVLLEAKTEFTSNVSADHPQTVTLSELILGIETLPNEPELLKDHLTRTHSQRSAIMALVDRVDEVRRGQGRENADFLSEAIRRLTSEGVEGLSGASQQSSFLIRFLAYLSQVSALVQEAAPCAVSLFDILSEEPEDLVARVVFDHRGFTQAQALCELMHIDLVTVVERHSHSLLHFADRAGETLAVENKANPSRASLGVEKSRFINLEIVEELLNLNPDSVRPILLCVERRSALWPSSGLLDFGVAHAVSRPLRKWIEERRSCWNKFVFAHTVLTGHEKAGGLLVEEEQALDFESKAALASVASDSQAAMDALTRMVARAHMKRGDYLSALVALDEGLSTTDDELCGAALMGCLESAHGALSPERIYELLWRLSDVSDLLRLSHQFCRQWDSQVAVRTLLLCAHRLASDEAKSCDLDRVLHEIRVIDTMAAVAAALPAGCGQGRSALSWQRLADMHLASDVVTVISALISVHEHSLACDFLELKGGPFIDEQADRIELSRLRHMFLSGSEDQLVARLQQSHHPLKASRLAMQLMDSIDSVRDRTLLGELLKTNGVACEEDGDRLDTQLAALALMGLTDAISVAEWGALKERPDLVLESLLLNGHTLGLAEFLLLFPSWRNDQLVLLLIGRAIGLDGNTVASCCAEKWKLTGDELKDAPTRKRHMFAKCPDVPLALRLVSLLCSETDSNGESVFQFIDQLSLFLHEFVAGRVVSAPAPSFVSPPNMKCPFSTIVFLRQAMVSLLRAVEGKFSVPRLALPVEHGISNITLIGDLWQRCRIRVGLAALSDRTVQALLRDALIQADCLDLAARVCFATGVDCESKAAADVVTLHKAALALQTNDVDAAKSLLNAMDCESLSSEQFAVLETAMRKKPLVSLHELEKVHKRLVAAEMDQRLYPELRRVDWHRGVQPPIVRQAVLSHMKGDSHSCPSCLLPDESVDVCLMTPVVGAREGPQRCPEEAREGPPSGLPSQDLEQLLDIAETFGEPGASMTLLVKEGLVEAAVESAISPRTGGRLTEHLFVEAVAAVGDSTVWTRVLQAIRRAKEPASVTLNYLAAIEQYLRRERMFGPAYEYQVAMGREAQAGIVALLIYLETESWEGRAGWLASARRHLCCALSHKFSKRFLQRRRRRLAQGVEAIHSSSSEEDEEVRRFQGKIAVPFVLPNLDLLTEQSIVATKTLADLEAQACGALPHAPASASLFGSVQAVSELIDFLLMESQIGLAKSIVQRLRLPDSALCGIFSST